jgi:hypothetical protein
MIYYIIILFIILIFYHIYITAKSNTIKLKYDTNLQNVDNFKNLKKISIIKVSDVINESRTSESFRDMGYEGNKNLYSKSEVDIKDRVYKVSSPNNVEYDQYVLNSNSTLFIDYMDIIKNILNFENDNKTIRHNLKFNKANRPILSNTYNINEINYLSDLILKRLNTNNKNIITKLIKINDIEKLTTDNQIHISFIMDLIINQSKHILNLSIKPIFLFEKEIENDKFITYLLDIKIMDDNSNGFLAGFEKNINFEKNTVN